jgi:hypothetical protein
MEAQSKIGTIADNVKDYVETRAKLYMLDAADKTSSTLASLGYYMVMGVAMVFVLLFLSIGAAVWIGHAYGETSMGFLIIGIFYLLILIVVYLGRNALVKVPIVNSILKQLFSDEKY